MVQHDAHVFEWAFAMAIEAIEREFGGIEADTRPVDQLGNQSVGASHMAADCPMGVR